jgi:hypothetical protein
MPAQAPTLAELSQKEPPPTEIDTGACSDVHHGADIDTGGKRSPNHITAATAAPHVISPQCLEYITQYKGFKKATAEGIIGLAETLYKASKLPPIEFEHFCREVGLDQKGSTFRKNIKIGQMAPRFDPVIDQVPPR